MVSVSTLRNIFRALKLKIVDKLKQNKELHTEVNQAKRELLVYKNTRAATPVAQSIDRMKTPETHASNTQHPSSGRKIKSYII
jgi:hypothetical protein